MKLSLETYSANIIHSYEEGQVIIRQNRAGRSEAGQPSQDTQPLKVITGSLIITPEILIEDWLETPPSLTSKDILRLMETEPEVILLGTGATLTFPSAELLQPCYQANIGIEVMNTSAACRTYNVLASERRKVAAAMIII
ncbi:MAG: MTH938/NDUFAF3 family protein [Thioalkalispiraceae bacterium]